MRLVFYLSLATLLAPSILASGFTVPPGMLYTKLELRATQADQSYDNQGNRLDQIGNDQLINEMTTDTANLFLAYGITKRFSVSANVQFSDAALDFRFGEDKSNSGVSDIWLDGQYLLYKKRWNLVLNGGVKLPQQDNKPNPPQLSNGESDTHLSLGAGFGAKAWFFEGEVGYRWNTGFVNNVQQGGIAYEDEVVASAKAGWHITPRFDVEGLLTLERTEADLQTQDFIPGIYANADEDSLHLSAAYKLGDKLSLGAGLHRTLDAKNELHTEGYSIFGVYTWSR